MALQCAMSFNVSYYSAGASPSPQATLSVYNPNAVAVAVTGIQLQTFDISLKPVNGPTNLATPAMGPGQNVVVPALSSLTFGPFPFVAGSAANSSSQLSVPWTASSPPVPASPQLAEHQRFHVLLGGVVMGSDGSNNTITPAGVLVSYTAQPALLAQGGSLQFGSGNNLLTGIVMGVL